MAKHTLRKHNLSRLLSEEPESFYWMGFLIADGSFNKYGVAVEISTLDLVHLEAFRKYLKLSDSCTIHARRAKRGLYGMSQLSVSDITNIATITSRFDIHSKKTYDPPNLSTVCEIISDDNFLALFAGLVDGDGCIRITQSGKTHIALEMHGCWLSNLEYIEQRIYTILQQQRYRTPDEKLSKLNIRGHARLVFTDAHVLKTIHQSLQSFNLPLLSRKWDKIQHGPTMTERMNDRIRTILDGLTAGLPVSQISTQMHLTPAAICRIIRTRDLAVKKNGYWKTKMTSDDYFETLPLIRQIALLPPLPSTGMNEPPFDVQSRAMS